MSGLKTTGKLLVGNERGQGFKKGQCGNPGGRPKGLAALAREEVKDGKELVKIMGQILRGELLVEKTYYDKEGEVHTVGEQPNHRDRILAAGWFADRGYGKALETTSDVPIGMTEAEREKAVARVLAAGGVVLPPAK
jgi:hypothetical protein